MRCLYPHPHQCTQQRIITVLAYLCGKGPATGNSTPKHNPNTPKGRGSGCPELGHWCWSHKRACSHIPRGREGAGRKRSSPCTVGWVRAFPHVNCDLPRRVWKGFQGQEQKPSLRAGAAVADLYHLHLPQASEEQEAPRCSSQCSGAGIRALLSPVAQGRARGYTHTKTLLTSFMTS